MTENKEGTGKPFSSRDLREALSRFATGVTIVTTARDDDEPIGMTASSFNSVSMDPPLVLWSVTKTAHSAPVFFKAEHYSVHVLASDQVDLSNRFARSGEDKFSGLSVERDANGVPVIAGCVVRFDCRQWAVYEGGDHWIIVGEVNAIERNNAESLVFSSGSYATANPLRSAVSQPENDADQTSPIDGLLIYNLARAYRQLGDQFHTAVRDSGLTVPEWRILASLHGQVSRTLPDLAARTFIDSKALYDMVITMAEEGLCDHRQDDQSLVISGTLAGHERVEHLFELGEKLEAAALEAGSDEEMPQLISMLRRIIQNTDTA